MAESITEGTLKGWSVAEGDYVEEGQEIGSIETDKIDVAINSPAAGTVKKFLAGEEDTVKVGQDLVILELGGSPGQKSEQKAESTEGEKTEQKDDSKPAPPKVEQPEPSKEETKPDQASSQAPPTSSPSKQEPLEGKKETTPQASRPQQQSPPSEQPKKDSKPSPKQESSQSSSAASPYGTREERRVKMNRMRLRIAERLKQSQNTAASLTTFNEVDMSALMNLRKKHKDEILKKTGIKLGFMGAFGMASVMAMKAVPTVNASIEGPGGGDTIVYRDYVDISVAVATEKGLVTPVVRNVESMDIIKIESEIAALGKKVHQLHLHPDPW